VKPIPAHVFQAYLTCPREAWLQYHNISSDQEHELLALGRLIHETSYKRDKKEIFIDEFLKIDIVRDEVIAEVKKSSRSKDAARMQLLYYLYYLKHEKGIERKGVLLFPKERKKEEVELTQKDEHKIEEMLKEIERLVSHPVPPKAKRTKYCRSCAFYEYCFAEEE